MRDSWCTKLHTDKFFSKDFNSPRSTKTHQCSILIRSITSKIVATEHRYITTTAAGTGIMCKCGALVGLAPSSAYNLLSNSDIT